MGDYPENEKLSSLRDSRVAIGRFLEWLEEEGIELIDSETCDQVSDRPDSLWMRFAGIDENKLEEERQAMLTALQEYAEQKNG